MTLPYTPASGPPCSVCGAWHEPHTPGFDVAHAPHNVKAMAWNALHDRVTKITVALNEAQHVEEYGSFTHRLVSEALVALNEARTLVLDLQYPASTPSRYFAALARGNWPVGYSPDAS